MYSVVVVNVLSLMEEVMALHGPRLPHEHCIPGHGEPRRGPPGRCHCRVLVLVASHVSHGHGQSGAPLP